MKLKFSCLIAAVFLFALSCFAQVKEFNFINYTQENGLPSNETYYIYRDSKDFLWIATDKGVARYDGNKMENFDLPDNVVFKIKEDDKGRIWFFSHTGKLAYFFNGAIYPYKYNENIIKAIKNIIITNAYVDSADNIIINSALSYNYKISSTGVVEKFNYTKFLPSDTGEVDIKPIGKHIFFPQVKSHVRVRTTAFYQFVLQNNNHTFNYHIPLGTVDFTQYGCVSINDKDVFFFSGNNIIKFKDDGSYILKKLPARVLCMYAEKGGNMWVGLEKAGVILINPDLEEFYTPAALIDKSISSVTEDYEGGTWLSTLESGIYFLKNKHINRLVIDSSLTKEVFRMCSVNDSVLLYANQNGLYSLKDYKVSLLHKLENYKVHDLFTNDKADIFLATKRKQDALVSLATEHLSFGNLILFASSSEIVQPVKNSFFWNNGGHMVNATFDPDLLKSMLSSGFLPNAATFEPGMMFADKDKQVWLGTINTLYKVSSAGDKPIPFKDSSALFKKGITCMRQLYNGIYTIGIRFGGIALMKDTSIIGTITESDGLLNNSIKYMLPTGNQLWVATPKGISVIEFKSYDPIQYNITNIGKNEGFYNLIINQLVQYRGNILAATSNGIYAIEKPWEILNEAPEPIPLYINNISYYKGDTSNISSISVPYNKNSISIRYAAVCFNTADEVKYYYRFAKTDTSWQLTTGTQLLLENLSPGIYNIELKAALPNQHRESAIQKLQVIVETPWWQNNWFRLAVLVFILLVLFFSYRARIAFITRKEQQNAAIRIKLMELEQTALRSQMNPHFIFNCLTSIQQLVVTGDREEANEYLVKFARLIRKTLELSARSFITIDEEVNYLNEYVVLEQLRIPGSFDFIIYVDDNLDKGKTEIPNMMLQPIIENCIRHGIKHLQGKKGRVDLSITKAGKSISCVVVDNGVGRKLFEKKRSDMYQTSGYGMAIVKRRLEVLSENSDNGNYFMEVEDLFNKDGNPEGTKVILQLPFKTR